jgi:hypothetical protein
VETKVLTITKTSYDGARPRDCPALKLQGNWLNSIGFSYGKLAIAEYGQDSIILRLQDSGDYRLLVKSSLKSSSGLFQVRRETNNKLEFPRLDIWGSRLERMGFTFDSVVMVRYEYGLIKLSLVDTGQLETYQGEMTMPSKVLKVNYVPGKYGPRPCIKISGNWLNEIGFTCGKVIAVKYSLGKIILRLLEETPPEFVTGVWKDGSRLIRVRRVVYKGLYYSYFCFSGVGLVRSGFTVGKTFAVLYEYGLIKLLVIEPERFQ